MVVERQPVDHFVHGLEPGGKASAVQPADLQSPPQALGGRVVPAVPAMEYVFRGQDHPSEMKGTIMPSAQKSTLAVSYPPQEARLRIELAAAYRLFAELGWHELIYNHITVRIPGAEQFLINPFGLMYREVTASNLVKVDLEGNILSETPYGINPAGFIVHSAVHGARRDVGCVIHMHTTAGLAVACQKEGLLPLSFPAMFYTDRIAYHEFEGITIDSDECKRLAVDLGDRSAMILRNHGLLTCGPTIADAFAEIYHLQRACEVQIAAQSAGAHLNAPSASVTLKAASQHDGLARAGTQNALLWQAMMRWMDRIDPSYRS